MTRVNAATLQTPRVSRRRYGLRAPVHQLLLASPAAAPAQDRMNPRHLPVLVDALESGAETFDVPQRRLAFKSYAGVDSWWSSQARGRSTSTLVQSAVPAAVAEASNMYGGIIDAFDGQPLIRRYVNATLLWMPSACCCAPLMLRAATCASGPSDDELDAEPPLISQARALQRQGVEQHTSKRKAGAAGATCATPAPEPSRGENARKQKRGPAPITR